MAHYAWINSNNEIINVTVGVDENVIQNGIGGSSEAWEIFYTNAINQDGVYVKRTSYNGNIRGNYAGIGYSYLPNLDIFMPPKCHDEATVDSDNAKWVCENDGHKTISL